MYKYQNFSAQYKKIQSFIHIHKTHVPYTLTLTIELSWYDIEQHSSCDYDALTIRGFKNGVDVEEKREILCGNGKNKTFTFENFDEVKVGFYSDGTTIKAGFNLTWSSEYDPSIKPVETAVHLNESVRSVNLYNQDWAKK